MLRNLHLYENRMIYKQSECSIIWVGKRKMVKLIKRVWLMQEFEEVLEGCTFLKVGPSRPKVWADTLMSLKFGAIFNRAKSLGERKDLNVMIRILIGFFLYITYRVCHGYRSGLGNVRPAGHIRPAMHLNVARGLHLKFSNFEST